MRKVLFLDIDGVLNSNDTTERTPRGFVGIDDNLLNHLRTIINTTGVSVVLSSSWKDMSEDDEDWIYLVDKLKSIGVEIKNKTTEPYNCVSRRGDGINMYLHQNPDIKDFVILDDYDYDFKAQGLYPHFILTDARIGLTEIDVGRVMGVLNGELNDINYEDVMLGYQHS